MHLRRAIGDRKSTDATPAGDFEAGEDRPGVFQVEPASDSDTLSLEARCQSVRATADGG